MRNLFMTFIAVASFAVFNNANATVSNPAMLLKGSYFVVIEGNTNVITVTHEERFLAYANNAATCESRKEQLLLQPVQIRGAVGTNDLFDKSVTNAKNFTKYSTLSCELLAPAIE